MTCLFAHPKPIQVTADPAGAPLSLRYGDRWRIVDQVSNRWTVTSSWWTAGGFAQREYVKLVTEDGLLCTVYRDMSNDAWSMDRLYD